MSASTVNGGNGRGSLDGSEGGTSEGATSEGATSELVLFKNPRIKEQKYWQFIQMVAPPGIPRPPGGWKSTDCQHIYCMKCKMKFKRNQVAVNRDLNILTLKYYFM